jgi:acetyl-CoA acetyltransferase
MRTVPADSLYRTAEGLGPWEHRGKVAAVGIGHSPTTRRWDGSPGNSVGALAILAIRKAIADAGVSPEDVDGLVLASDTTTGAYWPPGRQVPQDFLDTYQPTGDPLDGVAQLSAEWLLKNMPELKNVSFVVNTGLCMSYVLVAAIQAVGDGHSKVCVAVKGWHNLDERYYHGGPNAEPTVSDDYGKWQNSLAGPACYLWAMQFQRYLYKYGKTHDMLAPFVINSRRNGLMFPEGYWAQNRPSQLTLDDYLNARWIAKPANLFDNDIPVQSAGAYVITTSERARDMKQKPVYVLGHAASRARSRGVVETLEEAEEHATSNARRAFEAAGITADDLSFENMYDGFSLFHVFHIEGIGYAGIKRGEALDFFQTDISISGPNPVSPSGGNIGGGRTRYWNHTDSMQQIQGRAGARQISRPAEIGISGGPATAFGNFVVWGATPG